jgi:hypothetical protein
MNWSMRVSFPVEALRLTNIAFTFFARFTNNQVYGYPSIFSQNQTNSKGIQAVHSPLVTRSFHCSSLMLKTVKVEPDLVSYELAFTGYTITPESQSTIS